MKKFTTVEFLLLLVSATTLYGQIEFTWLANPVGVRENFRIIAIDSSGILYAGTNNDIYTSIDDGNSWHHSFYHGEPVISGSVSPTGTVFVGTDDGWIFYSSDHGKSWQGFDHDIYSTTGIKLILAISDTMLFINGPSQKIFYDNGKRIEYVETLPGVSRILGFNDVLLATNNKGIFRSYDSAKTWEQVFIGRMWSNIARRSDGTLFAGEVNSLIRSDDEGSTWDTITTDFRSKDFLVANGPKELIAWDFSPGVVLRSYDEGLSWDTNSTGFVAWFHNLFELGAGSYIIDIDVFGAGLSTDSGRTWSRAYNDICATQVDYIGQTEEGVLFAGTNWNGLFIKRANEEEWEAITLDSTGDDIWKFERIQGVVESANGRLFVATSNGLFYSDDQGYSWTSSYLDEGITSIDANRDGTVAVVRTHTVNGGQVWSTWVSRDNGEVWDSAAISTVRNSCVAVSSNGYIYRANCSLLDGGDQSVYVSIDFGETWGSTIQLTERSRVYSIQTDRKSESIMIHGFLEFPDGSVRDFVRWSPERSAWQSIENDRPQRAGISHYAFDRNGIMYGFSENHLLFKLVPDSTTWIFVDSLKIDFIPNSLFITQNHDIIVGTETRGLYASKIEQSNSVDLIEPSQESPRVLSSEDGLIVTWPGGVKGNTVEVFDVLGRKVFARTIENGEQNRLHIVENDLPQENGVYIVRLRSGEGSFSIPIIW